MIDFVKKNKTKKKEEWVTKDIKNSTNKNKKKCVVTCVVKWVQM